MKIGDKASALDNWSGDNALQEIQHQLLREQPKLIVAVPWGQHGDLDVKDVLNQALRLIKSCVWKLDIPLTEQVSVNFKHSRFAPNERLCELKR